jgi:hypothetical protein
MVVFSKPVLDKVRISQGRTLSSTYGVRYDSFTLAFGEVLCTGFVSEACSCGCVHKNR